METEKLIFITGGARSGKSSFAEKYAHSLIDEKDGNLHYIATAASSDKEMSERIKHHQKQRVESQVTWTTWEAPVNVHKLVSKFTPNDVVLLDCLTILLTNEIFTEDKLTGSKDNQTLEDDIYSKIINGLLLLSRKAHTLIVVSNEVLLSPLNDSYIVQMYSRLIGHLHQKLVKKAKEAYLIEMSIPIKKKSDSWLKI